MSRLIPVETGRREFRGVNLGADERMVATVAVGDWQAGIQGLKLFKITSVGLRTELGWGRAVGGIRVSVSGVFILRTSQMLSV